MVNLLHVFADWVKWITRKTKHKSWLYFPCNDEKEKALLKKFRGTSSENPASFTENLKGCILHFVCSSFPRKFEWSDRGGRHNALNLKLTCPIVTVYKRRKVRHQPYVFGSVSSKGRIEVENGLKIQPLKLWFECTIFFFLPTVPRFKYILEIVSIKKSAL